MSWKAITMAAGDRAHQLGISVGVWQRQCAILGADRAALCLIIADRNSERLDGYRVRDVAGAFVGMGRAQARQGAVITSLLGELIGSVEGHRNVH